MQRMVRKVGNFFLIYPLHLFFSNSLRNVLVWNLIFAYSHLKRVLIFTRLRSGVYYVFPLSVRPVLFDCASHPTTGIEPGGQIGVCDY